MRAGHRATVDLDGEWRFVPDPERLRDPNALPSGEPIVVPGCWEAQVDRPSRIIAAWYHRQVSFPAEWREDRVILRFGAVMYRCVVWLDGVRVGDHEGGYTPFSIDATQAVRWGEEQRLVVHVINPLNAISEYPAMEVERILLAEQLEPDLPLSQAPHGKQTWYSSMSGIWMSVVAERTPQSFISLIQVAPDVTAATATVRWRLGGDVPESGTRLRIAITAPDGARLASEDVALPAIPAAEVEAAPGSDLVEPVVAPGVTIAIPDPLLWDIGQPNLYAVDVSLVGADGRIIDQVSDRFGMREVHTADGQVILNGRPVYMLAALDQDLYPDTISTAPSRELLDAQIARAQELGLNLLRCHIKVPDRAYVDAADEAGMLLWCELPNWTRFSAAAATRGKETLRTMVETLGNHPSIIVWTIINEDWGTQLRFESRDRQWLRQMYDWLKALDPTRLVVDNSACPTPQTPNFHLRTDLADFHVYFGMPDNAIRWRNAMEEFARRPKWLWSPHGDASTTGEEPLILSEFGNWGLPRLDAMVRHYGREPWWFGTGQGYYRPTGMSRRFATYGLDRIWSDVNALADATQWHQFEALQFEINQMRRHASIQGYVVTELTDAYWEANGLLDVMRGPKVFHDRFRDINAPDVVVADLERRDVWGGGELTGEVTVSSYGHEPAESGVVAWTLALGDGQRVEGTLVIPRWPRYTSRIVGRLSAPVPDVSGTTDGTLRLVVTDDMGRERARDEYRIAVLPASRRAPATPLTLGVRDPLDIWSLARRATDLGHTVARDWRQDVVLASALDEKLVAHATAGAHVLVHVHDRDAVSEKLDLARHVQVHLRTYPHTGWPGQPSPWEGDWVNSFSWILPGALPGVPDRAPLDFAYEQVMPDHVLLGHDPVKHRDEVLAGMFVGWIHTPAAIIWRFDQGRGSITLTTFQVSPEDGPVATVMMDGMLQLAAAGSTSAGPRDVPAATRNQETAA